MSAKRLWDRRSLRLAARAPHAYVTVQTAQGPHVTPVLFAITADRLWFAVALRTLKARVLRRNSAVGLLIDDGSTALLLRGEASVLEPQRPHRLALQLAELARAPLAIPSYGLRNPAELLAFARDAARRGPKGPSPNLVLVSVRAEILGTMPSAQGARRAPRAPSAGRPRWQAALAELPEQAERLAGQGGAAVLGWSASAGALAVPAIWDPDRRRARTDPATLRFTGSERRGPVCVCRDESRGAGPLAKDGVLLRGEAQISRRGGAAFFSFEPERITYWSGFNTQTAPARPRQPPSRRRRQAGRTVR